MAVLRIDDPTGYLNPASRNMPFTGQIDPTGGFAPTYSPQNPPLPPVNPFRSVGPPAGPSSPMVKPPVGAQPAAPGGGNLWDALRALFSGQQAPAPQGQGMTGMLQPRGQAGASTDALGNPFNRFG